MKTSIRLIFFFISFTLNISDLSAIAQKISSQDSLIFLNLIDSIKYEMKNNVGLVKQKIFALQKIEKWQNSPYFKSVLQSMLGRVYHHEFKLDSAKFYFEKALAVREKHGFKANLASTYENIAALHEDYGEDSIALGYLYRSLAIKKEINNLKYLAPIYSRIGNWHFSKGDYDSTLFYYAKSIEIFEKRQNNSKVAKLSSNIAAVYFMQDKNDEALIEYKKALLITKSQNDSVHIASILYSIGGIFDWVKNNDSALYYFASAKSYLEPTGNRKLLGSIYQALAETHAKNNNSDSSIYFFNAHTTFRDSVFNSDKAAAFLEFETKYKTKEKEQALQIEAAENKDKQGTILLLTVSIVGLFISLLFIYRYFRQKKKVSSLEISVKNQKIDSLLKDQESNTYIALLQGQQDERKRISQDLHDRIGGTLAALKVHFELASSKVANSNNSDYEKLVGLVDEAVKDVRNISHDLASSKLISQGLKRTLSDLVDTIDNSKVVSFNLFMSEDISFKSISTEQEIYSIIQELLSNALKHAMAKSIDLSINLQGNIVNILFEDDGIGFRTDKLESNGLGLGGIRDRIAKLNGELHIDSTPNRGSIFNINIPK